MQTPDKAASELKNLLAIEEAHCIFLRREVNTAANEIEEEKNHLKERQRLLNLLISSQEKFYALGQLFHTPELIFTTQSSVDEATEYAEKVNKDLTQCEHDINALQTKIANSSNNH
ncbi:MAG TPA: hypothetical protein VFF74_05510 [Methylophilaceae bacterium]|nr:hypothetical protein [Methylophilaceae bacterium]